MAHNELSTGYQSTADTSFILEAACRNHDTRIFIDETDTNIRQARKICDTCPVTQDCLEYGLSLPTSTMGVYAGLTSRQLNKMRVAQQTVFVRHGTYAGYCKERRHNLPICDPCRQANTQYHVEKKRRRT